MKADFLANGLHEDIYLLKPNLDPDPSVQIAVTRVGKQVNGDRGTPIALLHGAFTNRGIWKSYNDSSFITYLINEGFDPWLVEMRGHGDSPFNNDYRNNSLERIARYDLEAVTDFIIEQTDKKPVWLGFSWGGVCISVGVALEKLTSHNCSALILIGAQAGRYPFALRTPLIRSLVKAMTALRKKPYTSSLGPEPEPPGIGKEFVKWASLFTPWRDSQKRPIRDLLSNSKLPVFAVAGENDRSDPPKYCQRLAESFGGQSVFIKLKKYTHANLVLGKDLDTDLWPRVIDWIKSNPNNEETA